MKLTPQQIKTVDYSSIFKAKITFRLSWRQYTLPYTFVVEDIAIYVISLAIIRQLFGRVIDTIGGVIMFGSFALSLSLPYLILRLIKQLPTDGKPIYIYLKDLVLYFLNVILPKKRLYKGDYQNEESKVIVFKKE